MTYILSCHPIKKLIYCSKFYHSFLSILTYFILIIHYIPKWIFKNKILAVYNFSLWLCKDLNPWTLNTCWCVCLCVGIYVHLSAGSLKSWRARCPGAGVTDIFKPSSWLLRIKLRSSARAESLLIGWSISTTSLLIISMATLVQI